ncbi:MAG: NAD(P)/FAD-dependent oxidoreductase [Clostridiales bacterium]|nr:NAD(P)/FAD-dependent oxidoreductase [Clostridiales bacterium]
MSFYITKPIKIALGEDVNISNAKIAKFLRLREKDIKSVRLHKQSIDARNKSDVHFVCSYVLESDKIPLNASPYSEPTDVLTSVQRQGIRKKCLVVGAGPAGLFCALYLCKVGISVTVIERGSDVDKRSQTVKKFFDGGEFDEKCNVQFGLGGAGTFSDGKLTTGISSPLTYTVFQQLFRSGAPQDILTSSLPHVGTDKLTTVVANLRDEIIENGGEFLFDRTVEDFLTEKCRIIGVKLDDGTTLYADFVALACGHSARNTFYKLADLGAEITFKPFAVGLRIEHPREFINTAQYGTIAVTHRDLPAASYKLVHNGATHSCYSFCMCPGGVVVAANSENGTVVVNGMSNYNRDAANSNSALVVNVTAEDVNEYGFGNDAFAGVRFQQYLEKQAYKLSDGNYRAPSQNVTDFLANRPTKSFDLSPSYPRGVTPVNLRNLLPQTISGTLAEGLYEFDRKIKGFGASGVLTAVESRTSAPVKILRNELFQSNIEGLFPIGEGAGYAGGIVSSAVDGLRVAQAIIRLGHSC